MRYKIVRFQKFIWRNIMRSTKSEKSFGFTLGRNTLLVPVFRGCFRFGLSVLISFDWVPFFFNPFSILPLMLTPLGLILRGRWKAELANTIWPIQLPSLVNSAFLPILEPRASHVCVKSTPTREKLNLICCQR